MASIAINNLQSTSFNLSMGDDSYLHDISQEKLDVSGGLIIITPDILAKTINASRDIINGAYQAGRDFGNGVGRTIYDVTH